MTKSELIEENKVLKEQNEEMQDRMNQLETEIAHYLDQRDSLEKANNILKRSIGWFMDELVD